MMDLKRTLFENNIKQQALATSLGVTKQRVWHWVNVNLPMAWERLLEHYFRTNRMKIYDVEVKKT